MKLSTKQKQQLFFLLLAALWGALIFYLSSVPDLKSGFPSSYDFVLRKFAHMGVFFILTYFIASSFDSHKRSYLLFVIIAAVTYAMIDELHQTFVPGRHGAPNDIFIDSIGVYFGVWFYKVKPPAKLFKKRFV